MDEAGVPKGIRVLFNIMQQPSDELRGFSTDSESTDLGNHIGSGTTAVVFSNKNEDGVVKVSRYGLKTDIEHELKILKELARDTKNEHIPTVRGSENFIKIEIGSILLNVPAMKTSPKGTPALLEFLGSNDQCREHDLTAVLNGVSSALSHMHKKCIFHLDVSPKNNVLADGKAILIDYSLARLCGKGTDIKGFMGTPNYTHREIFERYFNNGDTQRARFCWFGIHIGIFCCTINMLLECRQLSDLQEQPLER